jgi:hypothetical protein
MSVCEATLLRLAKLRALGADGVVFGHEVGSGLDRYVPPAHGVQPWLRRGVVSEAAPIDTDTTRNCIGGYR